MRYRLALFAIIAAMLCSCSTFTDATPEAKVFYTLSDIKTFADAAEKVYGNQVALGHVSASKQKEIDAQIVRLHRDFTIAMRAARLDIRSMSNADLQKLADELVKSVSTLNK